MTEANVAPEQGVSARELQSQVAFVTGGATGIGLAISRALAARGATVAIFARNATRAEAAAEAIRKSGGKANAFAADVSKAASVDSAFDDAVKQLGRVDILVNNAGVGTAVPATRETPEQFRSVIDINLNGCYWMAQACARVMQPGSSIINVTSVLGLTTVALPQAAYASSKAGLIGLTRDLAQQWTGRKGIRVNALAPGYFESEMTDQFQGGDYIETSVIPRTLMGRLGHAQELNAALIFLASDASSYVTGITLPVEGGMLTS
jgi:NAD(P)-dependent dehydrogenase (short-subunit alcohol dehydrogenase family)